MIPSPISSISFIKSEIPNSGICVHRTYVGEYATSLEMAGLSVSLCRLDSELARLLDRPSPGSPWIPIPISISSSAMEKLGLPTRGTVQGVRATPSVRVL